MSLIKTGLDYIGKFRAELMAHMPFYGDILSHIDIFENRSIKTAATNGLVIYYNPSYFKTLSYGERNYILLHELFHVLLIHSRRTAGRDPQIWNIAADYVVNGMLEPLVNSENEEGMSFKKPSNGYSLKHYMGQSVEELYGYIVEDNKNNPMKKHILFLRDSYDFLSLKNAKKLKVDAADADLLSQFTDEEMAQIQKKIEDYIMKASERWSHDRSIGLMENEINILKHRKRLPWKKLLKRFLAEMENEEVSLIRPERKYIHMDIILPGVSDITKDSKIDRVWAFIDSSGSIESSVMDLFVTELDEICRTFDAKINVAFWDTEVHEVYKDVTGKNLCECTRRYCGGTDAGCVYEYLISNKIKPRVLLILTDGFFRPVSEDMARPYRDHTIVVLSSAGEYATNSLGKIARL